MCFIGKVFFEYDGTGIIWIGLFRFTVIEVYISGLLGNVVRDGGYVKIFVGICGRFRLLWFFILYGVV